MPHSMLSQYASHERLFARRLMRSLRAVEYRLDRPLKAITHSVFKKNLKFSPCAP
jgi:hypothetical protein